MDEKVAAEVYSLHRSVLIVIDQSIRVASILKVEEELLEEVQQIAVALHYSIETLRAKLGLPHVSTTMKAPVESPQDLLTTVPLDNLAQKTESKDMAD